MGRSGQRKFCEKLNLPDCVRFGMEAKEENTEGDIPENRQGRPSQRQHMHKLRPFQKREVKKEIKGRIPAPIVFAIWLGCFQLNEQVKIQHDSTQRAAQEVLCNADQKYVT